MLVSSLKQTGYVATPACFRTFGLLGAVSSFSIVHLALPLPVFVAVQPAGGWPVAALSKKTVSFGAAATKTAEVNMRTASFILPPMRPSDSTHSSATRIAALQSDPAA